MNIERLKNLIENRKYTKKKIRLADGRKLSYSECGNIESGMPVLFCFGLMTSSVAIMFAHQAALQNNLRILAIDYPGIGDSTFQPERTLEGWADDVGQFCDKVLGKFSTIRLLGHSLGGLHVLALLSDKTFKARVTRTVLLCPWMYLEAGETFSPSWLNLARSLPTVFQSSIIPSVLTNLSSGSINLAGWSNPQQTQLQAAKLVTSYASKQGNAGNAQMVRLALSKSETHLPQNLRTPVIIYHGAMDHLVLDKSVAELVKRMKDRNCPVDLITIVDGDHNSVLADPKNLARVMSSIVGDPETWAAEIVKSLRGKSRSMPGLTKKVPQTPDQTVRKGRSLPNRKEEQI
jgi:pimeloyl-ACP methyl ester carboxylesterase